MKLSRLLCVSAIVAALCVFNPIAQSSPAAAQAANSAAVSAAERTGILAAAQLRPNAQGRVMNECNERVAPQFIPINLGLGRTVLLVMTGGPNYASCYGDGPGLTLFRQNGAAWTSIYSSRGSFLAVMPGRHQGASDLVDAGPGFSHPLYIWNGRAYAASNRQVPDAQMENAAIYPQ